MKQYLELLRHTMDFGNDKGNRTGTWARSIFGWQMRFDLKAGFPMVTTKKLFLKGIVHELIMFLKGETNNEYLVAQDVHIWDGWSLKEDVVDYIRLTKPQIAQLFADKCEINLQQATAVLEEADAAVRRAGDTPSWERPGSPVVNGAELALRGVGINYPTIGTVVVKKKGDLGPVYGTQWRGWKGSTGETIDQITEVIKLLRNNPDSRRMIVSAWNVADLPDESVSPQENVKNGKMALAACHCLFQFYTTPLTLEERQVLYRERLKAGQLVRGDVDLDDQSEKNLDFHQIPKRSLSCQLYQRSCDLFLGVPFNIASYALLTHMLAQVCNMTVDEFIWTGGDCHVYSNCFDQVEEQLTREPMKLPKLVLNPDIKEIDDFTFDDISVVDYVSHPAIKAKVSV